MPILVPHKNFSLTTLAFSFFEVEKDFTLLCLAFSFVICFYEIDLFFYSLKPTCGFGFLLSFLTIFNKFESESSLI